MAMRKIKKGDLVVVLAGKDKGKQGTVLRVIGGEALDRPRIDIGGNDISAALGQRGRRGGDGT